MTKHSAPTETLRQSLALLRTRRYGTFWFASLLSNIGTWAQQVAQPWLLLSLGASPFLLGLDAFALNAPAWALTLIGGVLADRADRRRVIALFQSIQMVCPTVIVILLLMGTIRPWIIVSLSLVVGITDALSMPSFQSIAPSIVERRQIHTALALNSTQFNLSRILGPALAGLLMSSMGAIGCFVASAVSYLPFILVALWILPRRRPEQESNKVVDRHSPFSGIRSVLQDRHLRGTLITVAATSALCGPLITFCPILVKEGFEGTASHFSMAMGAFGVGGLLGAIALLAVDEHRDRKLMCSSFAGLYGVVVILAGITPWFWSLIVLLVLGGMSMTVSNTSANTVLLTNAHPRLRGQTISLYMLAMLGGMSIGGLVTGLTTEIVGVRQALLINGTIAIALQLLLGFPWRRAARVT